MSDVNSNEIDICSASLDIEPRVATRGAAVNFKLVLSGADSLQTAPLPNLGIQIFRDDVLVSTIPLIADARQKAAQLNLHAMISALQESGSYSVRLRLPGIGNFESIFAIVEP